MGDNNNPAAPGGVGFASFWGLHFLLLIAIVVVALVLGVYWIAVLGAFGATWVAWWIRRRLRRAHVRFFDWWNPRP